jgi:hypothetical protein
MSARMLTARQAEVAVGVTLVVIGVLLRVWQPNHMAVEHFDEGVYASNLLCEFNGFHFPHRHLYAPPLVPALLEWALILSGRAAASVMWVNVLVGCLTVPSVWWVGRQWFGPCGGLTAAALAAFSEVHIVYSRTALTDPLLCLCLLWGVYFAWRAVLGGLPSQVIGAAAFAALAWWTKYNGWLTLAISGSGVLAWLVFAPGGVREWRAVPRWLLLAALAVAGWLPVLVDLQPYGGYAAVAENHAGYFVGLSGWPGSFLRQAANLRHWEGVLGPLQTLILMLLMIPPFATRRLRVLVAIGSACLLLVSTHALLGVLSIIGLALLLWETRRHCDTAPAQDRSDASATALAGWMLSAWFVGLLVAVPLYTPFPRLVLPWVVSTWLGAGLGLSMLAGSWRIMGGRGSRRAGTQVATASCLAAPRERRPPFSDSVSVRSVLLQAGGLCALAIVFPLVASGFDSRVRDRGSLRDAAIEIHREVLTRLPGDGDVSEVEAVILVVAEPALFYHLALLAEDASPHVLVLPTHEIPPADQQRAAVPVFVAVGLQASRLGMTAKIDPSQWQPIAGVDYDPSDLVLLNHFSPALIRARRAAAPQPETIRLYSRVR